MTTSTSGCISLLTLVLQLLTFQAITSTINAAASWHKVSVTGSYRPRPECSFSRCGDTRLCLIGGRGPNLVDILDTTTMAWTAGSNNDLEMHHVQAVEGPDGCAWIAGAWTGAFPNERNVDDIWKYCPLTNDWAIVTNIPRPRGSGGTVFYGGKLYLVSGNDGGHNTDATLVNWFDCYDPDTDSWSILPNVPRPRDHFHTVVLDEKLYVAGGRDSTFTNVFADVESAVDIYDFQTGEWSQAPDFPRPRGGTMSVIYKNSVAILGGEGSGRAWEEIDYLTQSSSDASYSYSTGPNLPVPRHGTQAVACGSSSAVWVAGGATVQGCCKNAKDTYVFFDGAEDAPPPVCTPSVVASLPSPIPSPSTSTISIPISSSSSPSTTPSSEASPSSSVANDIVPSPNTTPGTSQISPNQSSSAGTDSTTSLPSPSISPIVTEEQSSEASSEAENDGGPACFPNDALITLSTGEHKFMRDIGLGDVVLVSHNPDTYSAVYFLSHADPSVRAPAIRIETAATRKSPFSASPGHLVHVVPANQRESEAILMPMSKVKVGDRVLAVGEWTKVEKVTRTVQQGRFNPHTLHGDIVVNGVMASSFTTAIHPHVADVLLLPFRMAYRTFGAHSGVEMANKAVVNILEITYWDR